MNFPSVDKSVNQATSSEAVKLDSTSMSTANNPTSNSGNYSDKSFHRLTCARCRQRKARCDGAYPGCTRCKATRQKCVYDKPASISYVRHLERQVEYLAAKLKIHDPSSSSSTVAVDEAVDVKVGESPDEVTLDQDSSRADLEDNLDFNVVQLSHFMKNLEIMPQRSVNWNAPSTPFSQISDTMKFSHYFKGDFFKRGPQPGRLSGAQAIQLVRSIRDKCNPSDEFIASDDVINDYAKLSEELSGHAFPYFRPAYVHKFFRDFTLWMLKYNPGLFANFDNYLGSVDTHRTTAAFAFAIVTFTRTVVTPIWSNLPEKPEDLKAYTQNVTSMIQDNLKLHQRTQQLISENIFRYPSISIVQACLHCSLTESMIGGSFNNSMMMSVIASKMSIHVFEHFNSEMDSASTIHLLRVLWSCYVWDKIISSVTNKRPSFPTPPPISPFEMEYNSMDTVPGFDQYGNVLAEVDGRPVLITICCLSIILSDILQRHHYFTHVRIQLYKAFNDIMSALPEDLRLVFSFEWDDPVVYYIPLPEAIKLPPFYPSELFLQTAMSLNIEWELLVETFISIAENKSTSLENTADDKYELFKKLIKTLKSCSVFGLLATEFAIYKAMNTSSAFLNPWFRLQITKTCYKLLMNPAAIKLMICMTDELHSRELNKVAVPYNFVENPEKIVLEMPEDHVDPSMPPTTFVENIVFPLNASSNFKDTTRNRMFYLKHLIVTYIMMSQATVRRLKHFKKDEVKQVLGQSLRTIPPIVAIYNEQVEKVKSVVSRLPNPKFDGDLVRNFDYSVLEQMIADQGNVGDNLMKRKSSAQNTTNSPCSTKSGSSADRGNSDNDRSSGNRKGAVPMSQSSYATDSGFNPKQSTANDHHHSHSQPEPQTYSQPQQAKDIAQQQQVQLQAAQVLYHSPANNGNPTSSSAESIDPQIYATSQLPEYPSMFASAQEPTQNNATFFAIPSNQDTSQDENGLPTVAPIVQEQQQNQYQQLPQFTLPPNAIGELPQMNEDFFSLQQQIAQRGFYHNPPNGHQMYFQQQQVPSYGNIAPPLMQEHAMQPPYVAQPSLQQQQQQDQQQRSDSGPTSLRHDNSKDIVYDQMRAMMGSESLTTFLDFTDNSMGFKNVFEDEQ